MNPTDYLLASDGNGEAVRANVVANRQVGVNLLNVDSVQHFPQKFIATSGALNGTELDPSTICVFYGSLSGSSIIIDQFAPGYTDIGHQEHDIVVLKPSTEWANAFASEAQGLAQAISDANTITNTLNNFDLTIGTVSTGSPSSASVTGTVPNKVLNLTLEQGQTGNDGATWTSGSGTPSGGKDGDLYLRTSNSDVYLKSSGSWSVIANIKGAQGDPGTEIELTNDGTNIKWRYVGGSWTTLVSVASLKGDKGDGFTGGSYNPADGKVTFASNDGLGFSTGDLRGADGASLPSGGTTGQQLVKNSSTNYDYSWQTPAGAGDMLKSTYDPNNKSADAFSMDNMVEGSTTKIMTNAERTKLSGIEAGAQVNTVASVAGKTGTVTLTNSDVGLGSVTNDAQIKASDRDTNTSLGSSDTKVPSQKAVKTYVDNKHVAAGSNTQLQYNSSGNFAGSSNLTFDGNELKTKDLKVTGDVDLPAGSLTANNIDSATLIDLIYPVGSYYWNKTDSRNPSVIFGVGTWSAHVGAIYGRSSTSGSPYNKTGGTVIGEDKHTLTIDEIPAHTHSYASYRNISGTPWFAPVAGSVYLNDGSWQTGSAGGGDAHNIISTGMVGYGWIRTA